MKLYQVINPSQGARLSLRSLILNAQDSGSLVSDLSSRYGIGHFNINPDSLLLGLFTFPTSAWTDALVFPAVNLVSQPWSTLSRFTQPLMVKAYLLRSNSFIIIPYTRSLCVATSSTIDEYSHRDDVKRKTPENNTFLALYTYYTLQVSIPLRAIYLNSERQTSNTRRGKKRTQSKYR